ncbi:MAG: TlpA family protein disulfide reductase [Acidobacteriota bacterium]|nr:TlpA family protein disulfide reductase [Acidobacteriota bacterium]
MKLAVVFLAASALSAAVVSDVRFKISAGDLSSADALADEYYRAHGANSEYAAALAWLARGALVMKDTDAAARYLAQLKPMTAQLLKSMRPEDDAFLASAVGSSIETEALLLNAQGHRDQAIRMLESELPRWKMYTLQARIQKTLNLLTLEGKSAPEMERYRGQPVLLFLWAQWCGDCKAQAPVIARIKEKYEPRGLVILAPTRHYGGDLTPEQEDAKIATVWKESYAGLGDTPRPLSDAIMLRYGVSSTPTLVLIDRRCMVRMYRPYRMSDAELSRQIEAILN